ncbi:MAG: hypothetical protein ACRC3Y_00575 [Romboutsia sp.]|uniref:hypothetical protein n=1 Tax=Romboutsia sp. TaxID=1965302 RepID=UPI003F31E342
MDKMLLDLDKDIKRCEDVLIENNYLEIVIAVEELTDKYKNRVNGIFNDNDKVWNYTKKDLINIKEKLDKYKSNIVLEKNRKLIAGTFEKIRKSIDENKDLSIDEIKELISIINDIEAINNTKIDEYKKWNKLKKYVLYAGKQNLNISRDIIYLINLIL